jgi:hypothetical protein
MRRRGLWPIVSIVLVAINMSSMAQPGWAKHKTPPTPAGDPCAAPTAYVNDHIRQIKALQASMPNTSATLFDMLEGQKDFEAQKSVQISQLRYDADGVNALLQSGGCKALDIDRELAPSAK